MTSDPDAMWKPGYEPADSTAADDTAIGPDADAPEGSCEPHRDEPDVAGEADPVAVVMPVDVPPADDPVISRRRRLVPAVLVVVALVAVVVVVVITRPDRGRPEVGLVGAADPRRLPRAVDQLWETRLPGTGSAIATNLAVQGRDLVVVIVDDGSRDRAGVVALEALTGEVRWRRSFTFAPPEIRLVGVLGDRVILEQVSPSSRTLLAMSTADGSTIWERDEPDVALNTVLQGTAVISRLLNSGASEANWTVEFVDPVDGSVSGTGRGLPLSTDLSGTWFFEADDGVVSIDLSAGWSEWSTASRVDIGSNEQLVVVGDRLLVLGELGALSELGRDDDTLRYRDRLSGAEAALPALDSVFPSGGATFVGEGAGVVIGAELVDDTIRPTWDLPASVRTFAVTERGLVLALSDASAGFVDGADFVVVDAVSGDRLAASGPAPAVDQLPLIVGNGFVITSATVDGRERIGYDLDGTELWRLDATGRLDVGDELVATLNNSSSGFIVTMYGDVDANDSGTVGADG